MNIDIVVPQQITIPDDKLLDLATRVRERLDMSKDTPVHMEDLVHQAFLDGLIDDDGEFDGWELKLYECREYTDDELRGEIKSDRKKQTKASRIRVKKAKKQD